MSTLYFDSYPLPSRPDLPGAFPVWAPAAEAVETWWAPLSVWQDRTSTPVPYATGTPAVTELPDLGFRAAPATLHGGGWWTVAAPDPELSSLLQAGEPVAYGFRLDGEDHLLPDPRSRRQPAGVHGPSVTVPPEGPASAEGKPGAGERTGVAPGAPASAAGASSRPSVPTGESWEGLPVYELHIGTFTPEGTFDAAIEKLPHLVELGIGWVELLPVNAFGGEHNWGYDGVSWFAVHEAYGGPAGYRRFVTAAHELGLGVLQDVVYNHLGPSGNYLPRFGPYLHAAASNPWGEALNLDGPASDEVRAYILDNLAMFALDYDVDGFRLDAVHAFVDSRAVDLLEDMAIHMDAVGAARDRPVWLIAESDLNDPALTTARTAGGKGLTGQWSDDFHHALHVALTGETTGYYADFAGLGALAKVVSGGFFHDGTLSTFRGRSHGRPIDPSLVRPQQLVVCIQNHDQIGNRAAGERLGALTSPAGLELAAVAVVLSPFTPMLFMGEEWGAGTPWQFFTDHREDWLGEAVSTGRLQEFAAMGWDRDSVPDPQDPATFARSVLDWTEANRAEHGALLDLYRRLGHLRRTRPEFSRIGFADVRVEHDAAAGWLTWTFGGLQVMLNFSDSPASVPLLGEFGCVEIATGTGSPVPAATRPARENTVPARETTDPARAGSSHEVPGFGAVVLSDRTPEPL